MLHFEYLDVFIDQNAEHDIIKFGIYFVADFPITALLATATTTTVCCNDPD